MKVYFLICSVTCVVFAHLMSFGSAQTLLAEISGSFSSPNYPRVYDNNINQTWRIRVTPFHRIKLEFTSFDLQDSYEEEKGPCTKDYVTISEERNEIARYCGNSIYGAHSPRPGEFLFTNGNTATINFVSDYTNNDTKPRGFTVRYYEIELETRWRFHGNDSYVRTSREQLRMQRFYFGKGRATLVIFKISTMQSDALLFLVGKTRHQFFAVELRNGKFVVTCNFGWEEPIQGRVNNYPHVNTPALPKEIKAGAVPITRNKIMIVLSINKDLVWNMTFSSWSPRINSDGWIGGIPRGYAPEDLRQYVTTLDTHFRGCLSNIAFHLRDSFNVHETEQVGVTPGCQPKITSTVQVDDFAPPGPNDNPGQ